MANASDDGVEALRRMNATDPPSWLEPNPTLSETARAASRYLFSSLRPFSQKSPLDHLLVDGFDAEQIWQQIDLQSQPLLSTLRRGVKQLAKNPEEISQLRVSSEGGNKAEARNRDEWDEESDGFDEELDEESDGFDEERVEKEEGKGGAEEENEEEEEEEEEGMEDEDDEGEEENGEGDDGGGIEDKFLKIDELAKYLQKEEENLENGEVDRESEEGSDDDQDTEDDEESDEDGDLRIGNEDYEDEEAGDMGNARCLFLCSHNRTQKEQKRFESSSILSLQVAT